MKISRRKVAWTAWLVAISLLILKLFTERIPHGFTAYAVKPDGSRQGPYESGFRLVGFRPNLEYVLSGPAKAVFTLPAKTKDEKDIDMICEVQYRVNNIEAYRKWAPRDDQRFVGNVLRQFLLIALQSKSTEISQPNEEDKKSPKDFLSRLGMSNLVNILKDRPIEILHVKISPAEMSNPYHGKLTVNPV